jgi:SAM-dependent methyltransferase
MSSPPAASTAAAQRVPVKLNLGCGPMAPEGWINCDIRMLTGVDLCCDLRNGLPMADDCVDCIAAIHLLQDLAYPDIAPALREWLRVLRPGGVLRLAVPDLDKAVRAYLDGDKAYFYVPDSDARSAGAKLITQITWYGSVRTPCNFAFLSEWLDQAGYRDIGQCRFGATGSCFSDLPRLDNRERESLFVEAVK